MMFSFPFCTSLFKILFREWLIKQYVALLSTEEVTLKFEESSIKEIARLATKVNEQVENIGARRLHTILEKLLEEISFKASDHKGSEIIIDADYVQRAVGDLVTNVDLSRFIL